ncbi:MAG: DUF3299 domain-containing protein [Planctomycetota bacterium]
MRVLGIVVVFAALGVGLLYARRESSERAGNEGVAPRGMSERVMAAKGFIPPDAPLQPPPRPRPRRGARPADFEDLSGFEFDEEAGIVPEAIRALDGEMVEVIGVMYFVVDDPARVVEFFLMPDHTVCCYGTPRLNQILEVTLPAGRATEYLLDYYLIRGRLEIGPFYDEEGLALCLYRIADAEVEILG